MTDQNDRPLLDVQDLRVDAGGKELLRGVDLQLAAGEAVGLVGPSGCGKSLTARALLGLLPPGLNWRGRICWQQQELRDPGAAAWSEARGRGMGLVLQEPGSSLNPVLRVGEQIAEALRVHAGASPQEARDGAVELLAETRVPDPAGTARRYPHQLSGGMRQRVLLAAALACGPQLLIADEPTTALDVSVQKDILRLLDRIRRRRGMSLLFITHDLNLVPLMADQVAFMEAGRITGTASARDLGVAPLPARPTVTVAAGAPVLSARGLVVRYRNAERPAVAGVDLDLAAGRPVGLLGESGCGKTSLGRTLALHRVPQGGTLRLAGDDPHAVSGADHRRLRRRVQMLFQDPGASLNPRQTVAAALREAAGPAGAAPADLLAEVDLAADLGGRHPHQLSGGQRQRVALARCLAADPAVLIADEPTSALDAAARTTVLDLLTEVMARRGLALLLISHDVEVLQSVCAEMHVMGAGFVLEVLPGGEGFRPQHPYTRELVQSLPRTLRENPQIWQATPNRAHLPTGPAGAGCPHYGDCPLQKPHCGKELPSLKTISDCRKLRCPEAEANGPSHFIDT